VGSCLQICIEVNDHVVKMSTIAHVYQEKNAIPQWGRAKSLRQTHGFTAPQLMRYAQAGLIRSSHIKRPGQSRGVRLFHLGDIDRLISDNIDNPPNLNVR